MRELIVGTLVFVSLLGCAAPAAPPAGETALVFPLVARPADMQQARVAFEDWLDVSVRLPGSAFRVLRAGADRGGAQTVFLSIVPQSWGSNAVAKRDSFALRERGRFRAFVTGKTIPIARMVPAAERTQVSVLPPLDSRGRRWTWPAGKVPSHTAALCDRSPSATGIACTATSLRYSYDAWLPGALVSGSSFHVWIVGKDASTTTRVFEVHTPELPIADRLAYLMSARNELALLADAIPPGAGSALGEAITVVVLDLVARGGQHSLQVLSDLRQTSGPWAFDRRVPEARTFLRWLRDERLLPVCPDMTVNVCGLHFTTTDNRAPFDVRRGVALRELWTAAFAVMRPRGVVIRSECDANAFTSQEKTP